jgi:hypothetical protein
VSHVARIIMVGYAEMLFVENQTGKNTFDGGRRWNDSRN